MSCLKQIQYRFALFRNLYFGKVCSSLTEVCILIRFSGLESAASAPAAPTDNVPKQMPGQLCKTKAYMELVLVWLLIALYTSFFFFLFMYCMFPPIQTCHYKKKKQIYYRDQQMLEISHLARERSKSPRNCLREV